MKSWMCGALAVGLLACTAAADTLESVEKAIIEKVAQHKAYQFKSAVTQNMEMPEMKMDTQAQGTFEFLRKGDKWLCRGESRTKSTTVMQGQEQKSDSTVLMICDGEYMYTLTETDGQKSAMKNRIGTEQFTMLTDKAYFDALHKDHNLKLLPDETVDGKATWVIEATSKEAKTAPAGTMITMITYFDKDNGLGIKMLGKDAAGKTLMTSTTTDVKINPTLADDRFVFKAPAGVQVIDITQQGMPAEGAAEHAGHEQKAEESKKPAEPPRK
jgi:outer membrane lipoprotein-sorting protein